MTNPHLACTLSPHEVFTNQKMVNSPSNWPSLAPYGIKRGVCNLVNKKNNEIGHCVAHGATNHLVECNTRKKPWMSGLEQSKRKTDAHSRVVTLCCQI